MGPLQVLAGVCCFRGCLHVYISNFLMCCTVPQQRDPFGVVLFFAFPGTALLSWVGLGGLRGGRWVLGMLGVSRGVRASGAAKLQSLACSEFSELLVMRIAIVS